MTQPEPRAWIHTLHMECDQTEEVLRLWGPSEDPDSPLTNAFGVPGEDYSASYRVVLTPLYDVSALESSTRTQPLSSPAAYSLSHELWAMAQLGPGECVEDAVARMTARLLKS